ncbi:MAG: hypothetical protein HYV63_05320 [Candidatus Schekmanbacteria bacterium]|nr:hypothetical protein [Candidatus Schekmanbacteria bacterium]
MVEPIAARNVLQHSVYPERLQQQQATQGEHSQAVIAVQREDSHEKALTQVQSSERSEQQQIRADDDRRERDHRRGQRKRKAAADEPETAPDDSVRRSVPEVPQGRLIDTVV